MGALYHLKQRLVDFCNVIQQNVSRTDTVPSSKVVYDLKADSDSQISDLNDSLSNKRAFKITVNLSPTVTVPANGAATLLDNVNLSSYGTFDGAVMVWATGSNCVPVNCQGTSSTFFLNVRNLSNAAQTIQSVALLCFKN